MRAADRARQVIVSVSAVVAVVGALGGDAVSEAAGGAFAADATPVAAAGPAFSIWSVIYVGLVAYALWQWLPAQAASARHRRLGYLVAASMLLNAAWLLAVQAAQLWLSLVVIALLLVVLVVVLVRLRRHRASGVVDVVVTDGTMGLYLGWIVVASIGNVAVVLAEAGLRSSVAAPDAWAVAVLGVAGGVGTALALWSRGRLAPGAAICWGLAWVGVARLSGDLRSEPAAYAALVAAGVVAVVTALARVRGLRAGASTRDRGARSAAGRLGAR